MDRVEKAIRFATKAHEGQTRKGKDLPYIAHPFSVAWRLGRAGADETVIVAALLHDTVEDTPVEFDLIDEEFGEEVGDIVRGCSEDKRRSWEERKAQTIEMLPDASLAVKLVTCADKLDNLRDMMDDHARLGDALWPRFNRGREKQEWYYRSLARAIGPEVAKGIYPTIFQVFSDSVTQFFGPE